MFPNSAFQNRQSSTRICLTSVQPDGSWNSTALIDIQSSFALIKQLRSTTFSHPTISTPSPVITFPRTFTSSIRTFLHATGTICQEPPSRSVIQRISMFSPNTGTISCSAPFSSHACQFPPYRIPFPRIRTLSAILE